MFILSKPTPRRTKWGVTLSKIFKSSKLHIPISYFSFLTSLQHISSYFQLLSRNIISIKFRKSSITTNKIYEDNVLKNNDKIYHTIYGFVHHWKWIIRLKIKSTVPFLAWKFAAESCKTHSKTSVYFHFFAVNLSNYLPHRVRQYDFLIFNP